MKEQSLKKFWKRFYVIKGITLGKEEEISCFHFKDQGEITENPVQYVGRVYKKVLEDGTGEFIKAEYGPRTYQKCVKQARLEKINNEE